MAGSVPPLDALDLLVAAIRRGSISAAARDAGISQQSASAKLRLVERHTGLELIVRSPTGVTATPAGEVVAAWAEAILDAAHAFRDGLDALRADGSLSLRVAASQTVAAHYLPGWLLRLRSAQLAEGRMPTTVHLVTDNSEGVEALVREGAVDLGFIETRMRPRGLARAVVAEDELVLVAPPGHPWTRRDDVDLAEVAATPLVSREEGSGTRSTWEDEVARVLRRPPADPALVLSTTTAVRSAVVDGVAPALLGRAAVADDLALGRLALVRTRWRPITRPITALWRGGDDRFRSPGQELLRIVGEGVAVSGGSAV